MPEPLPQPAFGTTTMLMPGRPGRVAQPNEAPAGRWEVVETPEPGGEVGVASSPTVLVETPRPEHESVVHGFGGRVTPQGFERAHVGPRPARSDPPPAGSEPVPQTQPHPFTQSTAIMAVGRAGGSSRPPPRANPQPEVVEAELVSRESYVPPRAAMVRVPSQEWAEARMFTPRLPPRGDAPLPTGMAEPSQIDGFRELRTRLQAIAKGVSRSSFATLVVPIVSGSGGSFVARNLAAAFATDHQHSSILVDCNVNAPAQHTAFHCPGDRGLLEFLEERQSHPYESIERLVQPTSIPRLYLVPAGRSRSTFQEPFGSPGMRVLVDVLQSDSYVFLDGPAAKGSPDARILAQLADFVILVVAYGMATAEEIAQTAAMFDPNKFAGIVFNERP